MKRIPIIFFFFIAMFVSSCVNKENKNIVFEGEYPPLVDIEYTEDGQTYDIQAFEGQCILFFDDNIIQPQAEAIIEKNGGKIIEQMPLSNYYLVEVPSGRESTFVQKMKRRKEVLCCFFNTPVEPNSHVIILDTRDPSSYVDSLLSHMDAVKHIYLKYGIGRSLKLEELYQGFFKNTRSAVNRTLTLALGIADKAMPNEVVLINMSFCTPLLYGKRVLYESVSPRQQRSYKKRYEEELNFYSSCLSKMRKKGFSNYIITKSSGNDGYYNLDEVFGRLNERTLSSLKKNMIIVNAYDEKKDAIYTNCTSKKHELSTTIDISQDEWCGTSFSAPKLLGWIDRLMTENKEVNAQQMLQAIRNATPQNPLEPMTYEALEMEVKKLKLQKSDKCKTYSYVLDMTSNYNGEWDLSDGKRKELIKYTVHDTYSYEYLSGGVSALEVENCSNMDVDLYLNAIESDREIRAIQYFLNKGERQTFYICNEMTLESLSVNKVEVKLSTW